MAFQGSIVRNAVICKFVSHLATRTQFSVTVNSVRMQPKNAAEFQSSFELLKQSGNAAYTARDFKSDRLQWASD